MLQVIVITVFPELFGEFTRHGVVGRAIAANGLAVSVEPLRSHGLGSYRAVDDAPYGGGSGMVLRVDCLVAALDAVASAHPQAWKILLTPQGQPFQQRVAERWATLPCLAFVCGRYEGIDERVRAFVDEEASLGDFVLAGGELAAMAMVESCARLLPGALGNSESVVQESFSSFQEGGLEYPQYTRPQEFRGMHVPDVLRSGDHAKIAEWRRAQSRERTSQRRPDLIPPGPLY